MSRTAELQDARLAVLEWATQHADDMTVSDSAGSLATSDGQIDTSTSNTAINPAAFSSIRNWTRRSLPLRRLEDIVNEQRQNAALVREFRIRLGKYDDFPSVFDTDADSPTAFAETFGERIKSDRAGEHLDMHRDLWAYLTLSGRISAPHALSLLAYLQLAAQEAERTEVLDKAIDYGIGHMFLAGGAEGLKVAGISLGIFGSPVMIGTAAVAYCLLTKYIQNHSGSSLPPYERFHKNLFADLDGRADAVHDQVHLFVERIQKSAENRRR